MTRILFAAALALAFSLPATADAGNKNQSPAPTKKAKRSKAKAGNTKRAEQKTTAPATNKNEKFFDFLADELVGNGQLPGGELATVVGPIEHGSLIRYRPHFIAEILKSADDL